MTLNGVTCIELTTDRKSRTPGLRLYGYQLMPYGTYAYDIRSYYIIDKRTGTESGKICSRNIK